MKKIIVLLTMLSVLAFSSVVDARAHFKVNIGATDKIVCKDGMLRFHAIIANDGDTPGVLTQIFLQKVTVYVKGSEWWTDSNRDLGEMEYYLKPGQTKEIEVTMKDKAIKANADRKKVRFTYSTSYEEAE